jgi:hypothetical protein
MDPTADTEGHTIFWESGTVVGKQAMGVLAHLAADAEGGTTSHLCGLLGGWGSLRPFRSLNASLHQSPLFVAELG